MVSPSVAQAIDSARARHKYGAEPEPSAGAGQGSRHHASLGLQLQSAIAPEEGEGGGDLTEVQVQTQYQQIYDYGASAFRTSRAPAVAAAGGDNHSTIYNSAAASHPHPQPPRRTGALHGSLHAVCKRSLEKEASKSKKRAKNKKANSATVLDAAAAALADANATAVLEVTSLIQDFATNVCNAGQQSFAQDDSDEVIIRLKQDRHGVFCPAATTVTRIPTFLPQNINSASSNTGKTTSTSQRDHLWHTRFKELMLHKATHDTWTTKEKEHGTLHTWAKRQKLYYRNGFLSQEQRHQRGNPQTLSEEQYKCLKLVGFPFPSDQEVDECHQTTFGLSHNNKMNSQFPMAPQFTKAQEEHFDKQLAKFISFKLAHGTRAATPAKIGDTSLRIWLTDQRCFYLNRFKSPIDPRNGRRRKVLTDERYKRLRDAGYVFPTVEENSSTGDDDVGEGDSLDDHQDDAASRIMTNASQWDQQLAKFVAYTEKEGTSRVDPQGDPSLNNWVKSQRNHYLNRFKDSATETDQEDGLKSPRRPVMTDERYHKLCAAGFVFPDVEEEGGPDAAAAAATSTWRQKERTKTQEAHWDNQLAKYIAYTNERGTTMHVNPQIDPKLNKWVHSQRREYTNRFKERQYYSKNKNDEGVRARNRSVLTDRRYQKLCQVGFLFPDMTDEENAPDADAATGKKMTRRRRPIAQEESWDNRLAKYLAHQERFGQWRVDCEEDDTLKKWVRDQRFHYNNGLKASAEERKIGRLNGSVVRPILSDQRYNKLCQAGFVFPESTAVEERVNEGPSPEAAWDRHLAKYVAHKDKFVEWRVECEVDDSLKDWVKAQRYHYNNGLKASAEEEKNGLLKGSVRRPVLSDQRYDKLCQARFVFPDSSSDKHESSPMATSTWTKQERTKTHEAHWDNQLAKYIAYTKERGTIMHVNPQIDPKLNKWVNTQRCEYTNRFKDRQYYSKNKNDEGVRARNRPVLTDRRYEKLCQVGFLFPDMTDEVNAAVAAGKKTKRRRMAQEEPWDNRLAQYVAHQDKFGQWRVGCEVDETLKDWVKAQRYHYNNGLKASAEEKQNGRLKGSVRRPVLSDQRYDKLCQAGFVFPDSASGKNEVPPFPSGNHKHKKKRRLAPSPQVDIISSPTGTGTTPRVVSWETQLAAFIAYQETHGYTGQVSATEAPVLSKWVTNQRNHYVNRFQRKKDTPGDEDENENDNGSKRTHARPVLSDQRYDQLCQAGFIFPDIGDQDDEE
jgi:hypothetical protein